MNVDFIMALMDQAKTFEQSGCYKPGATVEDFRRWLNDENYKRESPVTLLAQQPQAVYDLENEICKQFLLLSRFSRQLIRKGLADFPQLANEEFTYLYRLMNQDGLTKMQLIEKNAHEKQTGIEIIKRLVQHGFIAESQCPDDKRSTRLSVTPLGREIFERSIQAVTRTALVLSGSLETSEKHALLAQLKKLNDFHFTLYHNHRQSGMDDLVALVAV